MAQHLELIDEEQNQLIRQEVSYDRLKTPNKNCYKNDSTILYLNIRSLNANFNRLEILIESLKVKPYIIVCAESWIIDNNTISQYNLKGYKFTIIVAC